MERYGCYLRSLHRSQRDNEWSQFISDVPVGGAKTESQKMIEDQTQERRKIEVNLSEDLVKLKYARNKSIDLIESRMAKESKRLEDERKKESKRLEDERKKKLRGIVNAKKKELDDKYKESFNIASWYQNTIIDHASKNNPWAIRDTILDSIRDHITAPKLSREDQMKLIRMANLQRTTEPNLSAETAETAKSADAVIQLAKRYLTELQKDIRYFRADAELSADELYFSAVSDQSKLKNMAGYVAKKLLPENIHNSCYFNSALFAHCHNPDTLLRRCLNVQVTSLDPNYTYNTKADASINTFISRLAIILKKYLIMFTLNVFYDNVNQDYVLNVDQIVKITRYILQIYEDVTHTFLELEGDSKRAFNFTTSFHVVDIVWERISDMFSPAFADLGIDTAICGGEWTSRPPARISYLTKIKNGLVGVYSEDFPENKCDIDALFRLPNTTYHIAVQNAHEIIISITSIGVMIQHGKPKPRRIRFSNIPELLTIPLTEFDQCSDEFDSEKIQESPKRATYVLSGACSGTGSHYTSYFRSDDQWFAFNDAGPSLKQTNVDKIQADENVAYVSYLLVDEEQEKSLITKQKENQCLSIISDL